MLGTSLGSFCIAGGGGWIALIAYALLDQLGWRIFILVTSIPLFIPPIIILHFCLEDSIPGKCCAGAEEDGDATPQTVQSFYCRIFKTSSLCFINMLQGWGAILLLPALLRYNNEELDREERGDPTGPNSTVVGTPEEAYCASAIHGTQFLLIALVTGGANILGRIAGYLVSGRGQFRTLQSFLAIIITISYGIMVFRSGLVVTVVAMSIAKITYSMMMLEVTLLSFDPGYFGSERLATASAIVWASGACGAVVGNSFAAFLMPHVAVWLTFVFSFIQIGVVCSFTDK